MTDEVDESVGCFANVILHRCLLSAGQCRFAASRLRDQIRHCESVHKIAHAEHYFEPCPVDAMPVGTTLLKCRICGMVVADLEVESMFQSHYVNDHPDHVQDDKHYHQSYILANIEGQCEGQMSDVQGGAAYPNGESNFAPMEAVIIDQSGSIQIGGAQGQPILILNGVDAHAMSIINVNPSPPAPRPITTWGAESQPTHQKPITLIAEPSVVDSVQFVAADSLIGQRGSNAFSNADNECILHEVPKPVVGITPGARKSLPGAVAPPKEDFASDVGCFLCPGVTFASRDALHRHCATAHPIHTLADALESGKLPGETSVSRKSRPRKCPFCAFRSLDKSRFSNHLQKFHSSDDVFALNLSRSNLTSTLTSARKKRQRKGQSGHIKDDPDMDRSPPTHIPMLCSLCDFSTEGAQDAMEKHLREFHRLIRNVEYPLAMCSFGYQ